MRRERVQSNESDYSALWRWKYSGSPEWSEGTHNSRQGTKLSLMLDGIHGKVNRPESPCSHFKYVSSKPLWKDPGYPLLLGFGGANLAIVPPDGPICIHAGVIPELPLWVSSDKFNAFLHNASESFTEQFNEEVSLANFLIELTDFKSALKEAKDLFSFKHGGGFFRSLREFLHGRAKNGLGGNILDFELNWKSLVQDIPKIWNAHEVAMKRLQFLMEHQQFHTHDRRRFLVEPGTEGFDEVKIFDFGEVAGNWNGIYTVHLVPTHMQVTYNASAFVDNHLQLEDVNTWYALGDVLGLNNPVRITWNAVKLSWVADMFIDTEEFLDSFEKEAYNGSLVLRGGNCSWKAVRFYDVVVRIIDEPGSELEFVQGTIVVRNYSRVPTTLVRPALFALQSELNAHQQYLLGALGDAQLGITSGGYSKITGLASNFRKNKRTFGRKFWKRKGK